MESSSSRDIGTTESVAPSGPDEGTDLPVPGRTGSADTASATGTEQVQLAAVLDLFGRTKLIEEEDGQWNGGDVVDALGQWFGTDYQLTDAYGVTYTGSPAHLALMALARLDLSRNLSPNPDVTSAIRDTARLLIDWFTSEHTDPLHATETAVPPMRVCELVNYLVEHGNPSALSKVGPQALGKYTDHLLNDPVPSTEHPMPQLVDASRRSLSDPDSRWRHQLVRREKTDARSRSRGRAARMFKVMKPPGRSNQTGAIG